MLRLNLKNALKLILVLALINSSLFIGLEHPSGIVRLPLILSLNLSGGLLIFYFIHTIQRKFELNLYFKTVFVILMVWSLFTVFRSINTNVDTIVTLFGHYLMGWAWLTPLAIVIGFNIANWIVLFKFSGKILFYVSFFAFGVNFYTIHQSGGFLEVMAFLPILVLTFFIQNKRVKRIIPFAILAYLAFSYGNGQRVNLLFISLVLLFTAIEFLRSSKISVVKKYLAICSFSILALFLFLKFDTYVNELSKNDSLTTDTRTFLFVELFSDLSPKELLIGRGSLGTYFSEYFYSLKEKGVEGGDHYMRSINEVGYLHMILKGGFIMVILYLLILIPAAFLGIFRSKNVISRMCGYLILAYLLIWTISYYPVYSVEYIFLWMAVGSTVSEKARNMKIVTTPHPL